MTLGADVLQCVNQYLSQHNIQLSATDQVACFYRVQINGQIFYSARYGRVVKCNSFTVFFFDGSEHMYGHIQYFFYISTLLHLQLSSNCSVVLQHWTYLPF